MQTGPSRLSQPPPRGGRFFLSLLAVVPARRACRRDEGGVAATGSCTADRLDAAAPVTAAAPAAARWSRQLYAALIDCRPPGGTY